MKKLYASSQLEPDSDEMKQLMIDIVNFEKFIKENISEEEHPNLIAYYHKILRKDIGLPNKVFTIEFTENFTRIKFVFFDKEPDDKSYKPYREEDGIPYILVED